MAVPPAAPPAVARRALARPVLLRRRCHRRRPGLFAHRIVLASASATLRTSCATPALYAYAAPSRQPRRAAVVEPRLGADAFEAVLEFLYCGEVAVRPRCCQRSSTPRCCSSSPPSAAAVDATLGRHLSAETCLAAAADAEGLTDLAAAAKTVALSSSMSSCARRRVYRRALRELLADPRLDGKSEVLVSGIVEGSAGSSAP